jgi:hypothetical protein
MAAAVPTDSATAASDTPRDGASAALAFAGIAPVSRDGPQHPFVLREPLAPIEPVSPVIEAALPAGVVLFGAGLAGLTVMRIAAPGRSRENG